MMLRASSTQKGGDADIAIITDDAGGDGGIEHGRLIIDLVDAVMDDTADPRPARERLELAAGKDAVVETGAVIAMFNLNDRIADATGVPLDELGLEIRLKVGEKLGLEAPA